MCRRADAHAGVAGRNVASVWSEAGMLASRPRELTVDALVVDDDASFRRDLCECIEASGLTAVGAASGADAIRFLRLKNVRPRVVFLDLDMPEMDGFEFREWLRNERSLRSVPVVLVSGHPRVREYAQRLHATKALLKPISPEQVLACLGSVAAS